MTIKEFPEMERPYDSRFELYLDGMQNFLRIYHRGVVGRRCARTALSVRNHRHVHFADGSGKSMAGQTVQKR